MTKLQFKCGEVLPRWERYKSNPQLNLEWFIEDLWVEVRDLEDWIESTFNNPSVRAPAEYSEALLGQVLENWDSALANQALLASIQTLIAAYKTGAAHRILKLRDVIVSLQIDEESPQYIHHKIAREHYRAALELASDIGGVLGEESIRAVDDCIIQFCRALGAASRGINPE
ncbi:MAG: hypothetical protein AAF564_04305 [Bacteroidota bacterium]